MFGCRIKLGPNPSDLTLPYPPNWTAIGFFGLLGALHLSIAIPAFWLGRIEGQLSLILGTIFFLAALISWLLRSELSVLPSQGRLCLRTILGRVWSERSIPMDQVQAVRFTTTGKPHPRQGNVELLCRDEDIECPPTPVPHQQALCLALVINTRLIKVFGDDLAPRPHHPTRLPVADD